MPDSNIAIVVDSSCDVPADVVQRYGMYVVPLMLNYPEGSYADRVEITPEQMFERLPDEIPTTSTPTPAAVVETFNRIKADGHSKAIAITLSDALSGTYNLFKSVAMGLTDMVVDVVDSRSLALGAGLIAIRAAELVEEGKTFGEVRSALPQIVDDTQAFFTVETLKYLHMGGRLSGLGYAMGSMLDVRPVITSNPEGQLVPVAKTRGRKQSLKKMLALAKKKLEGFTKYNVAVVNSFAQEEANEFCATVKKELPGIVHLYEEQICPVLVTHGGPGLIGIAVQGIR